MMLGLNVAVFTDLYLEISGGIPSSIEAQKKALEDLGYNVTVFCPGSLWRKKDELSLVELENLAESGVVVVPTSWLKVNGAPMARRPSKIIAYLENLYEDFGKEFDVVHVHYEAEVSIAGAELARKYHLPLVQTMHGREDVAIGVNTPLGVRTLLSKALNGLHKHFTRGIVKTDQKRTKIPRDDFLAPTRARARMWELMVRQANLADVVLTPSQHFADKLKHYGVVSPVEVLSNGVADELVEKHDFSVRKVPENEPLKIVWSSRVSHEKRIIPFLESLVLVHGHSNNFFLTVFGDGNELDSARAFAHEHGLDDNIEFVGALPHNEIFARLADQHVSITNSFGFDTQGMTLLEATATGLPVIYCDPDMDLVVLPGTGLRAGDETPRAMSELICQLIDNPEKIDKMSKKALELRVAVLQSAQTEKLVRVYKSLAK